MRPLWLGGAALLAVVLWVRRTRLEPMLKASGALAVVAAVVYGSGLVELPDLEEVLTDLGESLGTWTYLFVGVLAFLETGAFVGLLVPGETAIVVGGVVAGQGKISVVVLIAITWTAAVAGDIASFALGRRLGREFLVRHGPKVSITEARLGTVEQFYGRHGGKAVFLGRFVGLVRAVSPFVAASSGMGFRRFLPYDVLGAGVWSAAFCMIGYAFWRSIGTVLDYAKTGTATLGTFIVAGALFVWVRRRIGDPEARSRVVAWMRTRRLARPFVGPTRFVWHRVTPGDLGLELTALLAVLVVGAAAVVGLVVELDPGETTSTDRQVGAWALELTAGTWDDLSGVAQALADGPVVVAVVALASVLLAARRRPVEAIGLVGGLAALGGLLELLDGIEERPPTAGSRPTGSEQDAARSTFPDFAAARACAYPAVAVVVARLGGRRAVGAVLVLGAFAVTLGAGFSRLLGPEAWLTDVAAGWALGAAAFAGCGIVALLAGFLRHNGGSRR